jgi:catalase-peroxidase
VGAEPAAAGLEEQGFGWKNKCGTGKGADTITSGLEGAWSANPIAWTTQYLDNLFTFEWEQSKSPAGAIQWVPTDKGAWNLVPDAHDPTKRHPPIMFTTDLSMKMDPEYRKIAERFRANPDQYADAFARAWFKLTHRDLGPRSRYLGSMVPKEVLVWQDPIPAVDHALIDAADIAQLKSRIQGSGLSTAELVRTAWASASSFRGTDMRGGANGARVRLAPQKDWAANDPAELTKVLAKLETIQQDFNRAQGRSGKKVSLADLIVLGGAAGIEQAARQGGQSVTVPFKPGRMDASQAQTDVASFVPMEPTADGFRNYYSTTSRLSPAEMLVDRANLLRLSVPEMTVLVGGMRALGANQGGNRHGVLTSRPGTLSNDFFVNLLDMSTQWSKSPTEGLYEGRDRKSGAAKWTATPVDLIFGSHSELRAIAEVYAANDGNAKFTKDFVAAWNKVMEQDRF